MKRVSYIPKMLIVAILFFTSSAFVLPQTAHAQGVPGPQASTVARPALASPPENSGSECGWTNLKQCILDAILLIPGWGSVIILQIAHLLVWISGAILNVAVKYSVVDMKEHLENTGSINDAWRAIRDLANMTFIFVLLYAAIQTILGIGKDTKGLIVKVVVVAILINFSLFITKFIIDISNVLAMTFYDAIAPGALNETVNRGLSARLMAPLNLQSILDVTTGFDGTKLLVIGVVGTIVALIASFVFFAVALMFIIRFVVLILVLVLSPIAFISFILPQAEKYRKQWSDALIGQAFFAPIYFILTWIVIKVSAGILVPGGSMAAAIQGLSGPDGGAIPPPLSVMNVFVNFIIMIVLLISSLVIAKEWANKAGPHVAGLTKWAMGAAGGATIGMAGRFGRGTFGRAGQAIADNEKLKEAASKGGIGGMAARLSLATSRKTAGASFDVRGMGGLAGQLDAGKAQKGGFAKDLKDKIDAQKKYADALKPSDLVVGRADKELEDAKKSGDAERIRLAQAEADRLKGASEEELRKREIRRRREEAADRNEYLSEKDAKKQVELAQNERRRAIKRFKEAGMSHEGATQAAKDRNIGWAPEKIKGMAIERKESYAKQVEEQTTEIPIIKKTIPVSLTAGRLFGLVGPVKRERLEEANAIRKSIKEKKPAEKIAEEIEKQAKDSAEETGGPEPTTPTPPTTPPPATPPPTT